MPSRKLPRAFYTRPDVLAVARDLLGAVLVVSTGRGGRVSGLIVETEAYRGPEDRASHAWNGRRTRRTETMYAVGGTAYVYFVYGMYHQFNVVTGVPEVPHAVLIRALEPVVGIGDTTHGPGLLCRAMHIDRELNGSDLRQAPLWIERPATYRRPRVARSARIGVDYAGDWALKPWRFFDRDSPYVSTISAAQRKKVLKTRG